MVVLISNAKKNEISNDQNLMHLIAKLVGQRKCIGNLSIICHSPVANFWNNFTITVINHPYSEPFLKYVRLRMAKKKTIIVLWEGYESSQKATLLCEPSVHRCKVPPPT